MNRRDMRPSDWQRILRREYISRDCRMHGRRGKESLLVIREVTGPLVVHDAGEDVLIAEKDYAWYRSRWKGCPSG